MTTLFQTVCRMSLAGSFVIAVVLAARCLFRKSPRIFSYLLWSLVFLRLACPVFPSSSFSLVPENVAVSLNTEGRMEQQREIDTEQEAFEITEPAEGHTAFSSPVVPQNSDIPEQLPLEEQAAGKEAPPVWLNVLSAVWVLGIAFLLCRHSISYHRLKQQLRGADELEPGVYEISGEHLSFVLGMFHPGIYLSSDLEPEERKVILCHEQVHLKRRDYLIKPACLAISCIHWFNPLVWLAFYLMNQDMEISCDEQVVRRLGEESKESYSRALLQAAARAGIKSRKQSGICALLSFGEDSVKKRILKVLSYRKPKAWALFAGVLLLCFLAAGLLSNPKNGLSEREVLGLLKETGSYGKDAEILYFPGDFDGNGKKEVFAGIGMSQEEGWFTGDFWFISEKEEAVCLLEDISMKTEAKFWKNGKDQMIFLTYISGNPYLTAVYGVRDGRVFKYSFDSPEEKYMEDDTLNVIVSDYEALYDREIELFSGHTQKAYPYYYEDGAFHPYTAEEISREQVKEYENGWEILEAIEKAHPGSQYQYLLRGNGLLHINRAEDDGDYISFAYTTCRITGNRMYLLDEGEGCYRKDISDEQEKSFAGIVTAEPIVPEQEWLGMPKERRAFAEQIRRCIEHEDIAGMYGLISESVHTSSGQITLENEEAFREAYENIFTPEVKQAVLAADLNQLFASWQGVCIGSGTIWFQPYTQSDGSIFYKIYSVNQPGMGTVYGEPDLKREWRNLCQQQGTTAARADEWFERMKEDGVILEDSYQFMAFFMGDWDLNGAVDWIFILELRNGAVVTDAYEERWLYIYKNGSLAYEKASPEDPIQEIESIVPEFTLEPGFEIW